MRRQSYMLCPQEASKAEGTGIQSGLPSVSEHWTYVPHTRILLVGFLSGTELAHTGGAHASSFMVALQESDHDCARTRMQRIPGHGQ